MRRQGASARWGYNSALGQVAQSVEQRTENPCVGGSIPPLATILPLRPMDHIIAGMKPSESVRKNRDEIVEIVLRHNAKNPRLFGSCSRNEDSPSSDIDLLIDPTETTTLFDIGAIRHELLELLGTPVDVVTPGTLPESFRATVIAEAKPL